MGSGEADRCGKERTTLTTSVTPSTPSSFPQIMDSLEAQSEVRQG